MFRKLGFATAFLLAGFSAAQAGVITLAHISVVDQSSQAPSSPAVNLITSGGYVGGAGYPNTWSTDPTTMFLTNTPGGGPAPGPTSAGDYVTFKFDQAYNLTNLKVWQFNDPTRLGDGLKTADVQVSSDGVNFSTIANLNLLQAAGNTTTDVTQSITLAGTATYVRLGYLISQNGVNSAVGLSQVVFSGDAAAVPEPMSISLLIVGVAGVWFTRRSLAV